MHYYYLVASLPTLSLTHPPTVTLADFLRLCDEHLTAPDRAVLRALLEPGGEPAGAAFAQAWHERETRLRNAVARARAARTGRDAGPYLQPARGFDVYTERAVAEAFARATPLERELELDRFRWQVLDELAGRNPFAAEAVFAYGLKLRMAETWGSLAVERGWERMDAGVNERVKAVDESIKAGRV